MDTSLFSNHLYIGTHPRIKHFLCKYCFFDLVPMIFLKHFITWYARLNTSAMHFKGQITKSTIWSIYDLLKELMIVMGWGKMPRFCFLICDWKRRDSVGSFKLAQNGDHPLGCVFGWQQGQEHQNICWFSLTWFVTWWYTRSFFFFVNDQPITLKEVEM